ncbi:MAG: hypothetical protein DPW09_38450 [Anaerolineae bacterium]|nr:hypothetical protein [Anaerolineales bacterium]MCQ3979338.1 hypothetical protein [Anaerolineae bacterium]
MRNETEKPKRLYYLEYTDWVPYYLPHPFEAVGFECRGSWWEPKDPDRLIRVVLPGLEQWEPDIIFWRFRPMYNPDLAEEPEEWLTFCQHLHHHPVLHRTKIMAIFSGPYKPNSVIKDEWSQRYDFYDRGPFRIIKHAKIAKNLVGEWLKGFEVINKDYLPKNGRWTIHSSLEVEQTIRSGLRPDAEGQFIRPPLTRILAINHQDNFVWIKGAILAEQPTQIVYITKDLSAWSGGLNGEDKERLMGLARIAIPNSQLLLGVDEALVQSKPNIARQVLEQVQDIGGWQIFVVEHMWFEGLRERISPEKFEQIVYEGIEIDDAGHWKLMTM